MKSQPLVQYLRVVEKHQSNDCTTIILVLGSSQITEQQTLKYCEYTFPSIVLPISL